MDPFQLLLQILGVIGKEALKEALKAAPKAAALQVIQKAVNKLPKNTADKD